MKKTHGKNKCTHLAKYKYVQESSKHTKLIRIEFEYQTIWERYCKYIMQLTVEWTKGDRIMVEAHINDQMTNIHEKKIYIEKHGQAWTKARAKWDSDFMI